MKIILFNTKNNRVPKIRPLRVVKRSGLRLEWVNLAKFLSKFASINSFCELKIKCIKSKILLNYDFLGGTKKLI